MMILLKYLGVAGWQIEAEGSSLLIDPYFTRISLRTLLVGRAIPDTEVIRQHTPRADFILVTHPHYDHIMDVPDAAQITGAPVYVSPQGCDLLRILGTPDAQICQMLPGDSLTLGRFKVEVYESRHRRVFGSIPYYGPLAKGLRAPLRAADYRMDYQYSFRLEVGDTRILVTSGIDEEPRIEADVLLVGADPTRAQLAPIVEATKPRLVLPTHWDDMFRPLSQPTRPMIIPPPTIFPRFERINLAAWQVLVKDLAPDAKVILPELFKDITIS